MEDFWSEHYSRYTKRNEPPITQCRSSGPGKSKISPGHIHGSGSLLPAHLPHSSSYIKKIRGIGCCISGRNPNTFLTAQRDPSLFSCVLAQKKTSIRNAESERNKKERLLRVCSSSAMLHVNIHVFFRPLVAILKHINETNVGGRSRSPYKMTDQ